MAGVTELLEDISEQLGTLPERLAAVLAERGQQEAGADGGQGGGGQESAPDSSAQKKSAFHRGYSGIMQFGSAVGGPFAILSQLMAKAQKIDEGIAAVAGAFAKRKESPAQDTPPKLPPALPARTIQWKPPDVQPTIPPAQDLPPVPLAETKQEKQQKAGWAQWPVLPLQRAQVPSSLPGRAPGPPVVPTGLPSTPKATPLPAPQAAAPLWSKAGETAASQGGIDDSGAVGKLTAAVEKLTTAIDKQDMEEGGGGSGTPEVSKGKSAIQPAERKARTTGLAAPTAAPHGDSSGALSHKKGGFIDTAAKVIKRLFG